MRSQHEKPGGAFLLMKCELHKGTGSGGYCKKTNVP